MVVDVVVTDRCYCQGIELLVAVEPNLTCIRYSWHNGVRVCYIAEHSRVRLEEGTLDVKRGGSPLPSLQVYGLGAGLCLAVPPRLQNVVDKQMQPRIGFIGMSVIHYMPFAKIQTDQRSQAPQSAIPGTCRNTVAF